MTKKISYILAAALIFFGSANVFVASATTTSSTACANGSTLSFTEAHQNLTVNFQAQSGSVQATVNNPTGCSVEISQASYSLYTSAVTDQVLFDRTSVTTVPAHGTVTLTTTVPSCLAQVDIYYGEAPTSFSSKSQSGINFLRYYMSGTANNFCGHTTPLTATCTASDTSVSTGTNVTYTAHVNGGSSATTYSWSGTDGLSGSNISTSKTYTTAGTKTADITVTSGSQSVVAHCGTVVTVPTSNLDGSCTASDSSINIGDSVTFTASATGGSGNYTYSWSGTNSLSGSGSSISKSYSTSGTKNAHVIIRDGSTSISRDCSTTVDQQQQNNLNVSCAASNSSVQTGSSVTYTASATGGDGSYSYSWSGTDSLSGSGQSVTQSYSYAGTKSATVRVTSNGQTQEATCNTSVYQYQQNNLSVYCNASNTNVPTGSNVTFYANASGGNGSYSYSWTGSNGLYGYGQSVNQAYYNPGSQYATVTVTSGGQSMSATCNTYVQQNYQPNNLSVSCSASQTSANVGSVITWYANVNNNNYYNNNYNGYNNNYYNSYPTFSWTGTDGLYGSSQTTSYTYNTPGQKTATVIVYQNGQSISQTCTVYINPIVTYVPPYVPPTYGTGVYLNQVPYTGFADNTKVNLFILGLLTWTAGLSYYFIRRKAKKDGVTMRQVISSLNPVPHLAFAAASVPVASSVSDLAPIQSHSAIVESLESHARTLRALVSADGLAAIAKVSASKNDALGTLENIVARFEGTKKNAEDWTVVSTEKINQVIA